MKIWDYICLVLKPPSRAEAARIRHRIAEAIEIDDEEVAMKMADVYLLDGLLQNSKLPCV